MKRENQGTLSKYTINSAEAYYTYAPHPLPPVPELDSSEVEFSYKQALPAIDALNDVATAIPSAKCG